ncbi:MAG: hypothetical protein L6V84_05195 [Oscillospiraceae bacterium]|nr:MAG: hypothetical protein L6V84_05195 [Oscillospiraceae bacterium]
MYSFTPNGRRRGLHAVVIVDLTASVLLWTSATAGGSYGWIFQLAGVVLAVLGIYLITRYSLRSYTFSVQDSELVDSAGNPVYDLVITQTLGRKISVVARVSLRDIRHLTVLSRSDFRKCRKKKISFPHPLPLRQRPLRPPRRLPPRPGRARPPCHPPDAALLDLLHRMGVDSDNEGHGGYEGSEGCEGCEGSGGETS